MNRYADVNGNPISYIDPFGLGADSDEMLKTVGSFLANALKKLGEQGSLYKAQNPVSRDPSITRAYRQDMIKRI